MQVVSIKMEESLLKEIDGFLKKNRYATRTEFIRDAIRSKLTQKEKDDILKHLRTIIGASGKKTSDKELHAIREKAFENLERELSGR